MKDFRSLEQKIRQVWIDEAEARNTAIRKKVENVGRPTDNVKDETSKLAKQGEIQRKIIDEVKDPVAPVPPKQDVDYIAKRYGRFSHFGGSPGESHDYKRHLKRLSKETGKSEKAIHGEIKKKYAANEEVELDEAGRVLPDLSKPEPKGQHSKDYLARIQKQKDKRDEKRTAASEYLKMKGSLKEEEVELDEVSKDTLQRYHKAAAPERRDPKKGEQRKAGMALARKKIYGADAVGNKPKVKATREEVEQIDELSTDTYHRAAKKAANKAMWDPEGRSGKTFKKYAAKAEKFRTKGMEQEKKERSMKEELELDESYDKNSKAHQAAKKTVKGLKGLAKAEFHSDGSASVHTKGNEHVSSTRVVDHHHDVHGLGYNRPESAYKKSTFKKDGLTHSTTATHGGHTIHIKEETIYEAGPETQPKEPKVETKDKKPAKDKDAVDAKEIKGGKTEVDLNPTTDDRDDDGKKIDDKAKKATKKANREGGIQEGSTNMFKSDETFGLPADLIATVSEALKGGQKKLDKNHNGKLDKQDFKMLRGMKEASCACENKGPCQCNTNEEVEQIDELSRGTLNSYVRKSHNQTLAVDAKGPSHKAGIPSHYRGKNKDLGKDPVQKLKMRAAGQKLAIKKLNKEEVELSAEELARIEEIAKGL